MKDNRILDPSNIIITSIKILKSEFSSSEKSDLPIPVTTSIEEYASADKPLVKINVHVRLSYSETDEGKSILAGRFSVEFLFELKDFDLWVKIDSDRKSVEIDGQMAGALRGIAYSTTRGMLYQHSMGTSFMGLMLPVLDPKKLVDEKTIINQSNSGKRLKKTAPKPNM